MKRRKFLVGMGSLAAGASAAMGTGALTKSKVNREVIGKIANDGPSSGYVHLSPGSQNGHHAQYKDGKLRLKFNAISGKGDGLNADSKNWFDNVFKVSINDTDTGNDPEDYSTWITLNPNMQRKNRIDFYKNQQGNLPNRPSIVGFPNRIPLRSGFGNRQIGVMINLQGLSLGKNDTLKQVFGNLDYFFSVHLQKTSTIP